MDQSEAEFAHLIVTIEPWLREVVIIGGWAYRLYCLHPSAQQPRYSPLMTIDADIAMPAQFESKDKDIRGQLLANGFEEERLGEDTPPATHYRLATTRSGFYAEFLTPLIGSEYGRGGMRKATRRVGGVVSQQLRYLDTLLHVPWTVSLDQSKGFPFDPAKRIQIANPVSFLAHKVLIEDKRKPAKFAKDILYIYDTVELFGARLPTLNEEWRKQIKPRLHRNSVRKIENGPSSVFGKVTDAIRGAAQIMTSRHLSPEAIRETCQTGLSAIFSE
jgi:hypothetical protein